ncbi:MAG: hypothetical protein ACKVXR_07505 [Planctomycetota bacterium]
MRFASTLALAAPLLAATFHGEPPRELAEARELLQEGQAAEALLKAKQGLESAPDLLELLDLASRAAGESGAKDEALWYGTLAAGELAGIAAPSKLEKAIGEALATRMLELDPLARKGAKTIDAYAASIAAIGRECASKKLYVNAVDLLVRCQGTSAAAAAEAELARIYANKKAVEALLDSGLDVQVAPKRKRSAEAIAREDAKHSTWETAHEIKGKQYTIRTDMGIELAESMSFAMEQMNAFYRKVFHVKEFGGGQTARATICVYRSREEFDAHEGSADDPIDRNVAGFFRPGANYVATYDPRSDQRSLASLWETLFHEASHQFTHMISADLIPSWLNEGTASYFEGARLRPNGMVETNLVPEERLAGLEIMLKMSESDGTAIAKKPDNVPTLEEVVSFYKPGSYPGEYYPFGWGLVYFFLNYEDERSRRVYEKPYQDFMLAYKSGGKHDVKGRFVEHFVTKAKQPGVSSFEEFEARWRAWIHELHALHFGPPEMAERLIARARKQVADKALESAEESYEWALRKRPGDPVASFELAELLADQKRIDAAIFRYRAAAESLRALEDPSGTLPGGGDLTGADLLAISEGAIAKLDPGLRDAMAKADASFAASVAETASAYAEQELPRASLALLDAAEELYGRADALADLRAEIAEKSGADLRRWRRLPTTGERLEWEGGAEWTTQDGALSATADHPSFCSWREPMPQRYTFEAKIDATGLGAESGFVGMYFGENSKGLQFLGFSAGGTAEYGENEKGWKRIGPLPSIKKGQLGSIEVRIEVAKDTVEFFLGGKSTGKPKPYDPEDLAGRIGFVVQGGEAKFRDVRVCY